LPPLAVAYGPLAPACLGRQGGIEDGGPDEESAYVILTQLLTEPSGRRRRQGAIKTSETSGSRLSCGNEHADNAETPVDVLMTQRSQVKSWPLLPEEVQVTGLNPSRRRAVIVPGPACRKSAATAGQAGQQGRLSHDLLFRGGMRDRVIGGHAIWRGRRAPALRPEAIVRSALVCADYLTYCPISRMFPSGSLNQAPRAPLSC
jgi:hypothetical protein